MAVLPWEDEHLLIQLAQQRVSLLQTPPIPQTPKEMRQIRQGEKALNQLIEANQRLIHRLAKYCRLPFSIGQSYEDLVQEATQAVIEAIHTFDFSKGTRLVTWVFHQIRTALNRQKRQRRRSAAAQAAAMATGEVAVTPEPGDPILQERLEQLLERLSAYQRSVITMRLEGYTFPEIGQALGKTAATVRQMFNRQMSRLKSWLEPTPAPSVKPDWMAGLRQRAQKIVRFFNRADRTDLEASVSQSERTNHHVSTNFSTSYFRTELEKIAMVMAWGRDTGDRSCPVSAKLVPGTALYGLLAEYRWSPNHPQISALLWPRTALADQHLFSRTAGVVWPACVCSSWLRCL